MAGAIEARELQGVILHYQGIPVEVTGTVATHPTNWSLIESAKRLGRDEWRDGKGVGAGIAQQTEQPSSGGRYAGSTPAVGPTPVFERRPNG